MRIVAWLLFVAYVFLLGLKSDGPTWQHLPGAQFGLEVALDVLAVAAALVARERIVAGAFVATLISTSNYKILNTFFGIKLQDTMGTWMELEINAPYFTFYALGALALFRYTREERKQCAAGLILSVVALAVTVCALAPGLSRGPFHPQHRILHMFCFAVSAVIYGYGSVGLASLDPRRALLSLGFIAIALSGLFFQVTEIFPGAYALDHAMDLSWTLGQFAAIVGLLRSEDQ